MKFCEFCRKELADNEVCTCEESKAYAKEQLKKRKRFLFVGIAIALVVAIAVIAIAAGTASDKIDPLNYMTVSFEGYSSSGVAKVKFNKDSLICDIIGDEPDALDKLMEWSNKYDMYSEGIEYSVTPSEKLSNGDTVTVKISITGTAQNKIRSATKEYEVKGLTEIEKVDVFKDLSVSFEGISGNADIVIDRNADSDFINACNFQCENQFNLSNGDKVTLVITNSDELASTYAKVPIELSKEYEVSGLGYYANKADQISKELIEDFAEQFIDDNQKENDSKSDTSFSYSTVKYYGSYFMFPRENAFMVNENELHIVVYYDVFYFNKYLRTNYIPIIFEDIVISADGTVNLQYEDGGSYVFTTDIELYLEESEEDYYVTKYDGLNIKMPKLN